MTDSANVNLVRSYLEAWALGDFCEMATRVHPTIEFVNVDGPEPGVWTGLQRLERGQREYLSTWEDYRLVADEYRDLDRERVLVLFHFTGHGRTSGVDLGQLQSQAAAVVDRHEGKETRIVRYWERERALADLGLAAGG